MGAGRKTKTLPKEKSNAKWTVNCSASARNITKNELAAVIFGCKHHTMQECLHKLLFGLPTYHFSYVKHITPGLPLFLFNYSDRTLHGIFEATSPGQMNIDPHAWLGGEEAECTPYGAQVRVRVLRRCRPLREEEFKPVMAKNYYEEKLFWFELDRRQANRLTKLFSASPLTENSPHRPVVARSNNMFDALPSSDVDEAVESKDLKLEELPAPPNQFILQQDSWHGSSSTTEMNLKESHQHSYASVLLNKNASVAQQWCQPHGIENGGVSIIRDDFRGAEDCSDELNVECASSPPNTWEERISTGDGVKKFEACVDVPNMKCGSSFSGDWGENKNMILDRLVGEIEHSERISTGDGVKKFEACLDVPNMKCGSSISEDRRENKNMISDGLVGDIEHSERISTGDGVKKFEACLDVPNIKCGSSFSDDRGENKNMISDGLVRDIEHSEYHSVVWKKLIGEVEELKVSHLEQHLRINSLEHELDISKMEINHLKERCNLLESGSSLRRNYCEIEGYKSLNSTVNELVFIVGGFDGCSWLPALSSYSPSKDLVKPLVSTTVRSYASAAKLNGEIYVFGGVQSGVWYDTVESYNPTNGQCLQRPSLNRRKGSSAGASLCEKIFAIGGGDGTKCFSEVEELDLSVGRWILVNRMLERRYAPGAVDMNGSLYVAGGFDGIDYLRSLERFDPRERSWTRLGSMSAKRGCHSLVAFNEKLYALGGYDGTGMVATVEVFDPRLGSWVREEPMKKSRGNFGSVVLGGKMYVIGGIDGDGEVLDAVEYYEEGRGWQVAGLRALGKRSFFSALVL